MYKLCESLKYDRFCLPVALFVTERKGVCFRVRGLVQGVGFRPTVWRLARDTNLAGDVCNDGEGVVIRAWGSLAALGRFRELLISEIFELKNMDQAFHFLEEKPDQYLKVLVKNE